MRNSSDLILTCEILKKKGPVDITEMIESFKFKRSTKKDNELELNIKQEFVSNSIDGDDFLIGATIRFQYGFSDQLSKVRLADIVDLIPEWGERIKYTVLARDKGHKAKKNESNTIFKNKTSSDIAKAIANKHTLNVVVDSTTKVWEDMPQGNKSDYELLRQLAQKEPGFYFYVSDDTLYFTQRKMDKKPRSIFTYGDGILTRFKVKAKESTQEIASTDTTFIGIDPMTGNINATSSDGKKDANLGKKSIAIYSASGDAAGFKDKPDTDGANKTMPDASGNGQQMKDKANALQQSSLDNALKASFEMVLNPELDVDELMTVNGIGKKYGGNWLITDVVDEITSSGAIRSSGEVVKDGTAKAIKLNSSDNTNKVNTQQGENKKNKKTVPEYNANGQSVKK